MDDICEFDDVRVERVKSVCGVQRVQEEGCLPPRPGIVQRCNDVFVSVFIPVKKPSDKHASCVTMYHLVQIGEFS